MLQREHDYIEWQIVRINKREPDYLLILAVLVGIGVVVTMKAQADAQSVAAHEVESQAVYHHAWTKIDAKVNHKTIRK